MEFESLDAGKLYCFYVVMPEKYGTMKWTHLRCLFPTLTCQTQEIIRQLDREKLRAERYARNSEL